MTNNVDEAPVVIIGSGAGGLFAAARLVLDGRKPVVLEQSTRLGGRFSTIDVDGFKIPTGAIAIPAEGPFQTTLDELGVDSQLRIPDPPIRVRIKKRELNMGGAAWEFLMKSVTKQAGRVASGLRDARLEEDEAHLTIEEWVRSHTRNKTVLTLIQSICASTFTCNADELMAETFFLNLRETGAFKAYGIAPHGNVAIADAMAAAVEARGGVVRRETAAVSIEITDGRATAVNVRDGNGEVERIAASAVISNAGPRATAGLVAESELADAFADRVREVTPTAMFCLSFSAPRELMPKCPGLMEYADTERLCMVGNMTALCPDLAPPGRTLYEAMSVPRPGLGEAFDIETEWRLLEDDLRASVDGYDEAEVVHRKIMSGAEPAMHSCPGYDLDQRTPIPNLVEAGDGVKPAGWTGTGACALSGIQAAAEINKNPVDAARSGLAA